MMSLKKQGKRVYFFIRNALRNAYRKVSRFFAKRDFYVVRIYYKTSERSTIRRDAAICDCELFNGVYGIGIFFTKGEAHAFADWRENNAPYGQGFIYVVEPATDAEIDAYLRKNTNTEGTLAYA